MSKFIEKVERETRIYIHNDLANAAFHLKENVQRMQEQGEAGISLHILGALTLYAFTFEAKVNFLGAKLNPEWKEFQSFNKKFNEVIKLAGLELQNNERPLSTFRRLKEFRDLVAHGKPIEKSEAFEQVVDREKEQDFELRHPSPHDEYVELEFLQQVSEDIDHFWGLALKSAKIEVHETITHFSGGKTYLAEASET